MRSLISVQVVMVLVEHLPGAGQVDHVRGGFVPRQFEDEVEIGARHLVIGRGRRQALQPAQLALGFLADVVGQVGLGQPAAQLVHLGLLRVLLAQFFLNGLQLLAQHVLALLLAHLGLGRRADLLAQLQHLDLVVEIAVQQPQRLAARRRFEQGLLAGHVEAEHRAEQVDEAQRILRLGDQLLDVDRHLHLGQLQHAAGQVEDGPIDRLDFRAAVLRLRQRLHRAALRYGSVCSAFRSVTRSTPCTISSMTPSPRAIFLMTARVPIG